MSWKSLSRVDPNKEYLIQFTYLPLKHFWSLPKFLSLTRSIQQQLGQSKGLIGYSVKANFLSRKFWTLSAWEDKRALMEFVLKAPHSKAMQIIKPHIGKTSFEEWMAPGSAIPPSWEEAFDRWQRE